MSYGFSVTSGTGSTITVDSENNAVGVYLDYFNVAYNTTVTRSYSSFTGAELFTILVPENYAKLVRTTTSINNSTKTVSVTVESSTNVVNQVGVNVIILGK